MTRTVSLVFHWVYLEIASVDLKGDGITVGEGNLFSLPLKHLEVFLFPSARPFSENAGSSKPRVSPPRISALLFQEDVISSAKQHLKAQGEYMPPNSLHKIFLGVYLTCFLTLYMQTHKIFPMKGYRPTQFRTELAFSAGVPPEVNQPPSPLTREILVPGSQ